MIGTIVNTCTIIAGSLIGALLNRGIKEKYKEALYTGLGLASLAIGLNATITNLPKSQYPVLFIVALAVGGIIGTALDIDGRFKRLVNKRSKGKGEARLGDGLSTAILLYCIGPLSMLGPPHPCCSCGRVCSISSRRSPAPPSARLSRQNSSSSVV